MRRVLVPAALFLFACAGGDQGGGAAESEGAAGEMASTGPMGQATVSGVVRFEGTAPANPTIDMSEESTCAAKYEGAPTDPQAVVSNGMLANVFVYVRSGLPAGASYSAPPTAVVLDQEGCLYHPRVFGVMVGQNVEIRNSDALLHNIKAVPTANRGFNISQPQAGMTTNRTFNTPEIMVPFECNVHGWMHAYAGVTSHPFFATSGEGGAFTIPGLPAGEYVLEAWHELFGTREATVTVPETGSVSVEFTFSPSAS